MMNIKQLKHFLALVEYGSYARASEVVHISQPALSRSIQQLEQQLGVQLFERGRMGASLSMYGRIALPHIRGVIAAEEALRQSIESIDGLESGELWIGVGPYPTVGLIDRVSARFIDRYPGIRLHIENTNWQTLHMALLGQEIELFIADIKELQTDPALQVSALPSQQGVVFCQANHPLLLKAHVEWQDLLEYPIALPHLPKYMEHYLQSLSLPFGGMKRRVECDNLGFLIALVTRSQALGLAPEAILTDQLRAGSLAVLPVAGLEQIKTLYGVVQLKGRRLSPAAEAYRAMIFAEFNGED